MNPQPLRDEAEERGASAVEYALLVALIAAVIIVTVTTLGTKVIPLYDITF
ncbi:MAG: Flp family type IVb pilin [Nocardioides sp.]|uniref:Flp family type IVb pilin n=1 Tax=Nocardioides sp. TaxID=35761 RepID=UPI0032664E20